VPLVPSIPIYPLRSLVSTRSRFPLSGVLDLDTRILSATNSAN